MLWGDLPKGLCQNGHDDICIQGPAKGLWGSVAQKGFRARGFIGNSARRGVPSYLECHALAQKARGYVRFPSLGSLGTERVKVLKPDKFKKTHFWQRNLGRRCGRRDCVVFVVAHSWKTFILENEIYKD